MCGLAGILQSQARLQEAELTALAGAMGDALAHRGPDDRGVWVDAAAGVALAHRRLSILDLSPLGHQPMRSSDGRYWLAYNGEIYNFAALRAELEPLGHRFGGHSDTEVLLAAVVQWGLEATLRRCNGMFAIALWDRREQRLSLARDRVGKKPLYYGWAGDALVFGSELKALWRHPAFDNGIDRDALTLLLRLDYIPAPHCIHERAFKLMPGRVLHLDAAAVAAGAAAHRPAQAQVAYWDARERMAACLAAPFAGSEAEAAEALDGQLRQAVALRMVADVPVGVFLSGGTDSALVASLMQAQSAAPVHSFSIGFEDSDHDEAPLAREVAAHLGCDHTELYVSGADALAVVPELPAMFDEPFADASQVPTALVARLARRGVTVALSGDGGDELFFGYTRYQRALRNWRALQRVPAPLRRWLGRHARAQGEASRAGGLAALLAEAGATGIGDVYRNRISRWRDPAAVVRGAHEPATFYSLPDPLQGRGGAADAMMLADFTTYLADDLLCKVDRTSMAASLEARAPLLDWQVAEFAWSLPLDMKLRDGITKYLPKQVLRRYLPDAMVFRGKRGFGAPVTQWLRGDLRDWAGDLLDPRRLRQDGVLEEAAVSALWQRFGQGERKWHTHLWNVLMFQAWQAQWQAQRAQAGTG
ncbi:MAG: asparagine synthase (glutamine-hydrolyzing) [Lysobacteraceae bacterium SCN 69-123]|mgnify:FL=1|uniref:asparagine synthase (glutamine-hydrolyzing) n=1 Tax=Stenotrophomonas acidaminiphila TaxID=128780 RepID=UPI00086ADB07|nr:asparagine synthase (glutamine-hydrolyzing) [Stenotrophomonas acidaminiphila]MDF9440262.1 asparagine synthase (glutamine-hydrolyzing) [Stenotrophomonas acidaminiphila]ODU45995.1 MAG: asparagine synthase (glutamine-hydrolyzing) [Xanthomonadaceae bacterium SCN 69-123]OJY76788.1 MAG: asparagine synthase (glutamine-hydrolyzing) [Stenotrophomonas sp. 69-14]